MPGISTALPLSHGSDGPRHHVVAGDLGSASNPMLHGRVLPFRAQNPEHAPAAPSFQKLHGKQAVAEIGIMKVLNPTFIE
jgi:hypothetical protein